HGAPGVVLEADQRVAIAGIELAFEHDVADHASGPGHGRQVEQADAGHLGALMAAVAVAQQLVAAAHGQHADAVRDRRREVGGVAAEVAGDQHLVAILAAAGRGSGVTWRLLRHRNRAPPGAGVPQPPRRPGGAPARADGAVDLGRQELAVAIPDPRLGPAVRDPATKTLLVALNDRIADG